MFCSNHSKSRPGLSLLGTSLIFLILCFALTLGFVGCGEPEQEEKEELITAKVFVGFDPEMPLRKPESWVPINVQLTNNTEPITGDLLVTLKDGTVMYRTEVDLPSKSPKVYEIYAYMDEMLDELELYVETNRMLIPIEIVTVTSLFEESSRILAVMSPDRGTHDNLAHRDDRDVENFRRVLYSDPSFLPDYWVGYRNITSLVWDGGRTTALTQAQEQALDRWIQMGGTLILAAGEYWQELSNSAFKLYVPVTLNSSTVLEEGTKITLNDSGVKPVLNSKLVIATGRVIDDPQINVLMKAGDQPFLVERPWGAGRILYVASGLDQPLFKNDMQQEIFLDYITKPLPDLSPRIIGGLDMRITSFLSRTFQAELPSTWFIGFYLGVYIILVVPVNYLIFRKIGRLEWAWLTVPIWAVLFAVGVYYIGALRQQGSVAVNEITVLEAHPNAPFSQSTTFCSIYSPVRQWYQMSFDPEAFPIKPTLFSYRNDRGEQDQSLTVRFTDQGPRVEDFLIYHWSQNQIKLQHSTEINEGLLADLDWSQGELKGTISNETGYTLHHPVVFMRNAQIIFDTLEEGETAQVERGNRQTFDYAELSRQLSGFNPRYGSRNYNQTSEFIQNELKKFYATSLFDLYLNKNLAVFAAEIQGEEFNFRLNDNRVTPRGSWMFVTVFELKAQFEGEITVDPNSWEFLQKGMRPAWNQARTSNPNVSFGSTLMQVSIDSGTEKAWNMLTRFPMEGGRIQSLQIRPNYQNMQFGDLQPGQRGYGMGMGALRTSRNPRQIFKTGTNHPPLEHQLQIRNQYTGEYEFLSQVSDEQGMIRNPALYVDRIGGRIELQMKTDEDWGMIIPRHSINVRLVLDFSLDKGQQMLGRVLDSDLSGTPSMEIQW